MAMMAGSRSGAHIQPENTVVPGMPRPGHGRTLFLVAGLGTMLVWYPLLTGLLAHHPFDWSRPALLGLAFNSMLEHLLAGRFDVDPAAIDFEAFLVGDRTVSYFGIFCALLRLPLLLTGGLAHTDITWISCLTAVCLGGFYQLRAVLLVRDSVLPGQRSDWLCGALIACILFGGQQVQFLRPTIYQEVIHWAGALSMIFVFLAVRGLVGGRGFDARTLAGMAICAGLALLTRVTFGVGLYAALAGLFLIRWRDPWRLLPAALVLLAFACVTGVVNAGRWGSPFVFADFSRYSMSLDVYPERLGRVAAYGAFNLERLWLGISYYFLPFWAVQRLDGQLLFAEAQTRLLDVMELPAGSFFLTDPLLLGLCAIGVGSIRRWGTAAIVGGLAVPPLLMLCAISMSWRYRMEFFPLLVFGALLGVMHLCRTGAPDGLGRGARATIVLAVAVSILVSHGMAALYAVSPWGPAEQYITTGGWVGTYAPRLRLGHD